MTMTTTLSTSNPTKETADKFLQGLIAQTLRKFDALSGGAPEKQRIKVRNWLIKKADTHPKLVCQAMEFLTADDEIRELLSHNRIDPQKLHVIALLHDTGRLREVDFERAEIVLCEKNNNYSHSEESYKILKENGMTDLEILLPIRYHNTGDYNSSFGQNAEFNALTQTEKEKIKIMWSLIVDADCLGNLAYQSIHGYRGTLEELSPAYHHQPLISPAFKELVLSKQPFDKNIRQFEKTFADLLVRFTASILLTRYAASRRIFRQHYAQPLYRHLTEEIATADGTDAMRQQALSDARQIYDAVCTGL